jgi:ABC-type uncharacterized transport system substrate-binding protein
LYLPTNYTSIIFHSKASICIRNPSQKGKQKEIVEKNTDQVLKKAIPAAEEDPIENV